MGDIFEWLIESKLARLVAGLILIGVSTLFYFGGRIWFWGWVVGGILLLAAIPGGRRRDADL